MPLTALTPLTTVGPYPISVAAGALDLTWTAADVANGNSAPLTGKEIILVWNTHATNAYTFTLTSQRDAYNRSNDITAYQLEAGDVAAFSLINGQHGWADGDGVLRFSANNAAVKFAILKIG